MNTRADRVQEKFQKFKDEEKPVMIVSVDEWPDENPGYEKTISRAVDYLRTNDLDAFFLVTRA